MNQKETQKQALVLTDKLQTLIAKVAEAMRGYELRLNQAERAIAALKEEIAGLKREGVSRPGQ